MRETWVQSVDWEDPLEESVGTYCSIFAWRIPKNSRAWQVTVRGVAESQTRLKQLSTHHFYYLNITVAKEINLAPARAAKSIGLSASLKHVIQSCQIFTNSNFLQLNSVLKIQSGLL